MIRFKLFITFFSALWIWGCSLQQNKASKSVLALQWEILGDSQGGTQSRLTITNTDTDTLKGEDWAVYFNAEAARVADADTSMVKIEMLNGDFFRLSPGRDWIPLPPDSSMRVTVISQTLKNHTDLPLGCYYVDQRYPNGVEVPLAVLPYPKADTIETAIAQRNFLLNAQLVDVPIADLPPVLPTPLAYEYLSGTFPLDAGVVIVADDVFAKEATYLQEALADVLTKSPAIATEADGNKVVLLRHKTMENDEGYELRVDPTGIMIAASTPAGAFYGVQSLKSLLPPLSWKAKQETIALAGIHITDAPRFGHRALMLDVSRNFQPKEQVLKVLDMMALYKLNVLHFHLNNDEGWRLEIPGLPELTDVGGKRGHTLDDSEHLVPSYGSGPDVDNATGTGYYSKADYIEILRYAARRHIRVIPEIETPGHARAAIKAMDSRYANYMEKGDTASAKQYLLRDFDDQSIYRSVQNWDDNVMDVALPSTYAFLEKVTDELIAMYNEADAPLATIHFGGDEVPEGVWERSPTVHRLLASDNNIPTVDELWYYFFTKVNDMLEARGLYLSGWEEIGMTKAVVGGQRKMVVEPRFANKNFHADVWNNLHGNEDLAYRLANVGYKVVLTNVTHFYFDLAYNHSFYESGLYWGGYLDVDKPFRFIPDDYFRNQIDYDTGERVDAKQAVGFERLTEKGRANIVGLQAPLWSERVTSPEQMEYMLLPKLLGLAERAWAPEPAFAREADDDQLAVSYATAWSTFINAIAKRELPKLDHYGGGYHYRIPTPGVINKEGLLHANVQLPGFVVRYTTDGSEPTAQSPVYTGPLPASHQTAFRVFNYEDRGGRTVKIVNMAP